MRNLHESFARDGAAIDRKEATCGTKQQAYLQ
jgi:hypothetical protein